MGFFDDFGGFLLGIVGGVAGFLVGGPIGAAIGFGIGGAIGTTVFSGGDTVVTKGPRLTDLKIQTSNYGLDIPKVYGTVRLAGNVIWGKDLDEKRKIRHLDGDAEYWEYNYYGSFAVALCEGEIVGVKRIWLNSKLYRDLSDSLGLSYDLTKAAQRAKRVAVYVGNETQEADDTIAADLGASDAPAYRGTAYLVFNDLSLKNYGNRLPDVTAEIVAGGSASSTVFEFSMPYCISISMTNEGDLITILQAGDNIRVHDGISDTIVAQFEGPHGGGTNQLKGCCVYNGNLYTSWQSGTGSSSKINLTKHVGISAAIDYTIELDAVNVIAGDCYIYNGNLFYVENQTNVIRKCAGISADIVAEVATLGGGGMGGIAFDANGNLMEANYNGYVYKHLGETGGLNDSLDLDVWLYGFYYERNSDWMIVGDAYKIAVYDGFTDTKISVNQITSIDPNSQEIVEDILDDAGISASMRDTSLIEDITVKGYVRSGVMTARRALEPLLAAYNVDIVEIDHKLKFIPRTGTTIFEDQCDRTKTFANKWDIAKYIYATVEYDSSEDIIKHGVIGSASATYGCNSIAKRPFAFFNQETIEITFWIRSGNNWNNDDLSHSEAKAEIIPATYASRGQNGYYEIEEVIAGNGAKFSVNIRTNSSGNIKVYEYKDGTKYELISDSITYDHTNGDTFTIKINTKDLWIELYHGTTQKGSRADIDQEIVDVIGPMARFNLHWHNYQTTRTIYWDAIEIKQAVTIAEDDLAAHEYGAEQPDKHLITRNQDVEVQREFNLTYISDDRNYQEATARSIRMSLNNSNKAKVEYPIVMSHNKGKQVAEILHNKLLTERMRYQFLTGMKYLFLAPTNVCEVDGHVMRIESMKIRNGILEFEGPAEVDTNYVSAAETDDPDFDPGGLIHEGPTISIFLDIPLLVDFHNNAGFYIAAHGLYSGWLGAMLYISLDGGSFYSEAMSILESTIIGVAEDALGDTDHPGVSDSVNTVTVRLNNTSMSLSSKTKAEVLVGENWAALGVHGAWEIIAFQTVTDNGDDTYTLSSLLRGLRGTEWAVDGHAAGDHFIMLDLDITPTDGGNLGRYNQGVDFLNTAYSYKCISLKHDPQEYGGFDFINTGVALKPYAPADIVGSRDGSNNLTITWKRSGRISNGWDDLQDVPLGEDSEAYEVDCYDTSDGSFGNVVRTIEVTSETASYTAAQQTADGLTPGNLIDVKVYQISAQVDRGYAGAATI